jgi:hypothetical protein
MGFNLPNIAGGFMLFAALAAVFDGTMSQSENIYFLFVVLGSWLFMHLVCYATGFYVPKNDHTDTDDDYSK